MDKLFVSVASLVAVTGAVALPGAGIAAGSAAAPVLSAKLTSGAEVPKVSSSGSGSVRITLNPATSRACWAFTLKGLDKPLVAHVLRGLPGKTGPSVIRLGGRFSMKGCSGASKSSIKAVVANPRAFYVQVQTIKHLNGAIRGQLHT